MRAAQNGYLETVNMLHAFDAHCINRTNQVSTNRSIESNQRIRSIDSMQARDATPLLLAAKANQLPVVKELLARGAAPALRLKDGNTVGIY